MQRYTVYTQCVGDPKPITKASGLLRNDAISLVENTSMIPSTYRPDFWLVSGYMDDERRNIIWAEAES